MQFRADLWPWPMHCAHTAASRCSAISPMVNFGNGRQRMGHPYSRSVFFIRGTEVLCNWRV